MQQKPAAKAQSKMGSGVSGLCAVLESGCVQLLMAQLPHGHRKQRLVHLSLSSNCVVPFLGLSAWRGPGALIYSTHCTVGIQVSDENTTTRGK